MVSVKVMLAGILLAASTMFALPARSEQPALILAEVYRDGIDSRDYWISEKLDGVRAYWDGKQLFFRSGNPVSAPAWFTRDFPGQPLDGELWLDRNSFEHLSGVVRKGKPVDDEWRAVRYMVFELPGTEGKFTERKDRLFALVQALRIPWLQAVEQFRVEDRKRLRKKLEEVVASGGEGLMLHRADALYSSGRNGDLLKLKPYLDKEATVVAYLPGKGRHEGRMGALLVRDEEGRRFRIGTGFSDAERDKPPKIGSQVTYRYRGLTSSGLPRFPVFMRVREAF